MLLLLDLTHVLHRGADGDELVLCLLPLTVVDQLLNLRQLRRRQFDPVVAGDLALPEQRRPHAVQRVARTGPVHRGAEPADAQHRGGHGSDDRERPAGAPVPGHATVQGLDGVAGGDGGGDGGVANVVAPTGEQKGQLGFRRVGRVHRLLGGEGFEEAVGTVDLVE